MKFCFVVVIVVIVVFVVHIVLIIVVVDPTSLLFKVWLKLGTAQILMT